MPALIEAYRAGLLGRQHWLPNIIAGVIVGVVALPLAMAFAIASGAKPEQGLYTAIVAGLAAALLGGSRLQVTGPTGAFIVILSGITATYGMAGLQLATLMAGLMLVAMGLTRMGGLIRFIPTPVIVGFTAGIAIIIWVGQWQEFFGLPAPTGRHFHQKLLSLLETLPQLHLATTGMAVFSLLVVVLAPRLKPLRRVPGPLLALIAGTLLYKLTGPEGVRTIGSAFGGIPQTLPSFSLPDLQLSAVVDLIGPAFTIAMLGAIESLLSAVVADGMAGTRHNPNQELIGQGIANILAPLFGGFAATGALARTATNVRNGATTPLSSVVHAITLIGVILLLAPLAADVPLAVLAAILFVVAWNMSELHHVVKLVQHAPRADAVILLVTLCLTVFADLVVAVNIGVILAMLQFLRRMSSSVEIRPVDARDLPPDLPPGVLVFMLEGPVFFGAVETFERALAGTHTDPKVLILRLRWVPFIDGTGLETLEEVIIDLHRRGVRVMITGANPTVLGKLARAGIDTLLGPDNLQPTLEAALSVVKEKAAAE